MRPIDAGAAKIRQIAALALCTALIFGIQVAMAALPNIELVSLLVILYTLHFGRKTLWIIYLFALLEGIFYGFGIWWVMYLYVWTILWLLVTALRRNRSVLVWAVLASAFGLCYGALCALPYWVSGGWAFAVAWWISGIPFDIVHCISNFVTVFVLFAPLNRLFQTMKARGLIPSP